LRHVAFERDGLVAEIVQLLRQLAGAVLGAQEDDGGGETLGWRVKVFFMPRNRRDSKDAI
jgi:hypothetical protein